MKGVIFSTERLSVYRLINEHIKGAYRILKEPEVDQYNTFGVPQSLTEAKEMLVPSGAAQDNLESLVVCHSERNEIIGLAGIRYQSKKYNAAEVWYKFHPDEWGNGYATEILKGMLNYGFNIKKLHRIEAGCAVENVASFKVMEKAGMTREGIKRSVLPLEEGWSDTYEYGILEHEWNA